MAALQVTEHQLNVLRVELGESLSATSVDILLTPPKQNVQCWFTALVYLAQTGDFIGAISKLIMCLIEQGANPLDFVQCIGNFIVSVIQGEKLEVAFIKLFNCILGRNGGNGNGEEDEVTPPNYREVKRCGMKEVANWKS